MEMVHFIPPGQRRVAMLAAQADATPVLVYGVSGTGKSAIAKWIHQNSPRSVKPFVSATRDEALSPQFEKAKGGTLFIPEIAEWPLAEQKIILDFLNTKSIAHPSQPDMRMLLNVRVMTSTSHSLEGRAQGGLFNAELLQKLNVYRIEMPELSKRAEEFEDIVTGILREITHELHREYLRGFSADAWQRLKAYAWPGNLRELRNVMRVAVIQAQGEQIESKDLPDFEQERLDFRATREQFEKIYITELLKTFNWQIDKACKISKLDKSTLLEKIKKYGIQMSSHLSLL